MLKRFKAFCKDHSYASCADTGTHLDEHARGPRFVTDMGYQAEARPEPQHVARTLTVAAGQRDTAPNNVVRSLAYSSSCSRDAYAEFWEVYALGMKAAADAIAALRTPCLSLTRRSVLHQVLTPCSVQSTQLHESIAP